MKPQAAEFTAKVTDLRLDRLLGRKVVGLNSQRVGRLEEFHVETRGRESVIVEYVLGAAGLLDRLHVGVKLVLGMKIGGYVARWDQLDISDPDRPRLTCGVKELRKL
jgi:hypothetical protein